jgi:hypothetical protein
VSELTPKADIERKVYEGLYGRGVWPPILHPPAITIGEMLDWHEQGCEWPVGGDELIIANSKNGKRS